MVLKSFSQNLKAAFGRLNVFPHLLVFVVMVMSVTACGKSPEEQQAWDWESAMLHKEEERFRKFVEDWPNSDKAPIAKRSLEALSWRSAAWTHTEESYRTFLAERPDSIFAPLAEEMVGWLSSRSNPPLSDDSILINLDLQISMRTSYQQQETRRTLARNTARFFYCAKYSVVETGLGPSGTATLDIDIGGSGVSEEYHFRRRGDATILSGTELRGSLIWHPSKGASVRREFAHNDAPPDTVQLSSNRVDDSKRWIQESSIERALEAPGSFWDQLVPLVLERAGPRAFLCPTGGSIPQYRAAGETSMPTEGAAVAAMYSGRPGRVEAAARIVASSGAPNAEEYLERYLEGFAAFSGEQWLAQDLLDRIRQQ